MQSGEEGSTPASSTHLDLYTIPNYSSWFSWHEIHETEKIHLPDFFCASSLSKTPKIYKQYRDFIINKYREDPSRRLSFTQVRKSLIGDVSSLHKIFIFLDSWGLINFGAASPSDDDMTAEIESAECLVKLEEGPPHGIRVVEFPNSSKVVVPAVERDEEKRGGGFRLSPLTSYSDVFGEMPKRVVCGNCGAGCESGYYETAKQDFVICVKCFKNENCGENKSPKDYMFKDPNDLNGNNEAAIWTDTETTCLLEAVTRHGDDWDLVAQYVQTKSKLDCISHLIQLPFGEHMLDLPERQVSYRNSSVRTNNFKPMEATLVGPYKTIKLDEINHENTGGTEQTGDGVTASPPDQTEDGGTAAPPEETEGREMASPPQKRRCLASFPDDGDSLMKQVALLSTVVGPNVAAAAAEAAVTALRKENPYAGKIFDFEKKSLFAKFGSRTLTNGTERAVKMEDPGASEWQKNSETGPTVETKAAPLTIQLRAAVATAFGAAAAHAKLLADQEDRELEYLIASIIELEMKKIQNKVRHFEELELIMEKEYEEIQKMKESVIGERMDVLRKGFKAGISRWRDHNFQTPLTGSIIL